MRKLISTVFAIMLCASAQSQSREVTDSGAFISDAAGRYVRLEGRDGVIVNYLYDDAKTTETSGVAVRLNGNLTLTVRYDGRGGITVAGMPALTSVIDHEGRTTAVQADRRTVAQLDYTPSGLVAAITVPARLTWKVSPPDSAGQVRQSVEDASGKVVARAVVRDADGSRRSAWYGAAAADLGVPLDSIRYESSPTGALTTARDSQGRVAFYVVHTDTCDVGFSPDGKPRFYDLTLSVFGGEIPPGSDLFVSTAWEAQRTAVPDHLVLTASGAAGLYVEEAAKKSITAAWMDRGGTLRTVMSEGESITRASLD